MFSRAAPQPRRSHLSSWRLQERRLYGKLLYPLSLLPSRLLQARRAPAIPAGIDDTPYGDGRHMRDLGTIHGVVAFVRKYARARARNLWACGQGARERLADRALGRSLSSSGKPWITLGSLLLGAASAHVFGHDGVITDLQLGVIHRQQTAQPGPRRHAHDARPQMPAAAKAAALPTRTKSLSSQPSSDTANGEIRHKHAETLSAVNAAFCPLPPEPVGQATPLSSLWPARRCRRLYMRSDRHLCQLVAGGGSYQPSS